jgi:hypothetical protein
MTTALSLPNLRPEVDGVPFPGTEIPNLPSALAEVAQWIDGGEVVVDDRSSRWTGWPDEPDFEPIYGSVSLNTGAAGIAWYSQAFATVLGDPQHAARARRAAGYVLDSWRDHADDVFLGIPGTGLAYYGGLAGIGSALLGLLGPSDADGQIRAGAAAVFDAILDHRGVIGGRAAGWTGINAMLGDGGIVVSMLTAAVRLGDDRYLAAAVAAGEAILAEERPVGEGVSTWPGVPGPALHLPEGVEIDGFELGTVGIASVFARLALATGDDRFRSAAARAARAVVRGATTAGDGAVLRRMSGDISFGYCTGSSGVIRALVDVHRATGDQAHLDWAVRFGRGILRSGVPARHTNGNGWVHHQCCGSAAILEAFLGLWAVTCDGLWLDAARVQGDDLLIRSYADDRGRRWYSESHILPIGTLKAEVGHQVGASGIALSLLRLHAANAQAAGAPLPAVPRLPDDPFPG